MAYTTIKKPSDYFNTKLYTGNGSTQSITGVGFQPDWIWVKSRSGAYNHEVIDVVRGGGVGVFPNLTNAESSGRSLSAFTSDGFTLSGSDTTSNNNGSTYASWNWLASNTTASNTDGSITSTVSANTTAGFSIVSYAGSASNITVGHGLGAVPKMMIFKNRDSVTSWTVYHESIGNTNRLILNSANAQESTNQFSFGTSPSSSVFALGGGYGDVNTSGANFIAYCFAEVKGFSKFGSYTGNGSTDGTFVYTGFKPAFVIVKDATNAYEWRIYDNKINPFNSMFEIINPNNANAQATSSHGIDFLSNGFKCRGTTTINTSGANQIYMAFAEEPLVGSNNVPATAR